MKRGREITFVGPVTLTASKQWAVVILQAGIDAPVELVYDSARAAKEAKATFLKLPRAHAVRNNSLIQAIHAAMNFVSEEIEDKAQNFGGVE
jgi:hypothetical protein